MKPYIIFIPGLFGTSLNNGEELVWPIKDSEKLKMIFNIVLEKPYNTLFPKNKKNNKKDVMEFFLKNISSQNLKLGPVLENYDKIIDFIKIESDNNYFIFGFDWRKSLSEIIEDFSKEIDKLEIGNREIVIIGHSLGGLLAYNYLASPELYDKSYSNFCKIGKLISIGAPIQGSIKSLTYLLGLASNPLMTCEETKNFLLDGFLKPIFELCPNNLGNLFYHKNSKNPLSHKQIIKFLRRNNFQGKDIEKYIIDKNNQIKKTTNPDINYLFITGSYPSPMCTGFEIDIETNEIECIYDNNAGDGTILTEESFPISDNRFKKRVVNGKHTYLTEIDETQNIIREELNTFSGRNFYMTGENVVKNGKSLEFSLFVNKSERKNIVTDIFAEHISFSNKTVVKDLTKKIENKKKTNTFCFNTKYNYGFLRFRNVCITFINDNGVEEKKFMKEIKIEIENNPNFF